MHQRTGRPIRKSLLFIVVSLIGLFFLGYLLASSGRFIGARLALFILIGLAGLGVLLLVFVNFYVYRGIGSQDGIVRRGPEESLASLTFDDGPNPAYTPQILDILKEKGVKATFFVVGQNVEQCPEIAQRIVAEGHDIGNHTYSHCNLFPASAKTVLDEVRETDQVIRKVTGVATRLFRPPRGVFGNAVRRLLVAEGYRIILWTVSSMDWSSVGPKVILGRIKLFARDGGIILFHDSGGLLSNEGGSRRSTVEALPAIIDYIREKKGFEIVPISEMLNMSPSQENVSPESEQALEKA